MDRLTPGGVFYDVSTVTLYTDASLNPQDKAGGWAVWAASDQGRIIGGGVIPERYCANSTYAEMAAVTAGVYNVVRQWSGVTSILVRCDNQGVAQAIANYRNREIKIIARHPAMQEMLAICLEQRVHLTSAWVKGHQKVDTRPAFVNNECDGIAHAHMRAAQRGKKAGVPVLSTWPDAVLATHPNKAPASKRADRHGDVWYAFPARFDCICAGCQAQIPKDAPLLWRKGMPPYEPACWDKAYGQVAALV